MDSPALARKHLERRLAPLRHSADLARPPRGWLRATRDALGMTTRQLARRLGVVQSAVVEMEKGEARDTISLHTLRRAAEELGCTLVYALVPKRPLEDMLRDRAALVADRQLAHVSHTMALENQSLVGVDSAEQREKLIEELLRGSPKRLWDEP